MNWRAGRERVHDLIRLSFEADGEPASRIMILKALAGDRCFRDLLIGEIVGAPFSAVFWETPPVTRANLDRPFECVLVDAPALQAMAPDPRPFAVAFMRKKPGAKVVVFNNLSADALLLAPLPAPAIAHCAHLAAFLRRASPDQAHALLSATGETALLHLSDSPLWVSTSGLGVGWPHIRLDGTPKYYTHGPYRRPDA